MCLCAATDPLVYHQSLLQDFTFKKNFYRRDNLVWQSGLSFNVFKPIK